VAKCKVIEANHLDIFFEDLKSRNGGKPTVLLGIGMEFTKANWDISQKKGRLELAKYRGKQP
jgi:hypothetical protein